MKGFYYVILFAAAIGFLYSCNNMGNTNNRGPIVLGDSSTIVTETDSLKRRDLVTDITPPEPRPEEAKPDTTAAATATPPATAAAQPAVAPQAPAATGNGLTIAFKEVTLFLQGIETKAARNQNLQNANGATYQLVNGALDGSSLKVTAGKVTKISMRYMSGIIAKNNLGTLQLNSLDALSPWQPMRGANNVYSITGLDAKHILPIKAGAGDIRNAVVKAARQARMSRKREREWENSMRNVRSVTQRPLSVYLRSVMFKVEGKDAAGKPFQKQVRIDMNP